MRFFSTTNYDDFKFMYGNRPVRKGTLAKVIRSIEQEGQLNEIEVNPTKEQGKWVIVDCQHRFTACRQLGIPVEVKVHKKDFTLRDLITTNTVRKNWSLSDVIKSYAELGLPHYVKLHDVYTDLHQRHNVSAMVVAKLAQGTLSESSAAKSKSNIWSASWEWVTNEDEVRAAIEDCARFKAVHPNCMTDIFVMCMHRLVIKEEKFNTSRLLNQAIKYPEKFILSNRKHDTLRMIEELYNWRKVQQNRLYIDLNL